MAKRVLVTGGSGFLGGAIVRELERHADYEVEIWDISMPAYKTKAKYLYVDLLSKPLPDTTFDVIFHCAAILGASTTFDHIAETEAINVQGTISMLDKAGRDSIIIRPGLFGDWPSAYMISTKTAEKYGLMYREYMKTKFISCRFTVLYGPGQINGIEQQKAIPTFIRQALKGDPLTVYGTGDYKVRLFHVEDAARLLIELAENYDNTMPVVTATSIVDENYISVNDLAKRIIRLTKSKSKIIRESMRRGQPDNAMDAGAIKSDSVTLFDLLGFVEKVSLNEGISETISEMRAQLEDEEMLARNKSRIGIVICAYDRDVSYVGELIKPLKDCGYYVAMGYDASKVLPDVATINACDAFISGGGHKERPASHLRNMRNGHRALDLAGCDYSLCITGDAVIKHPEKIVDLIKHLGKSDVISTQWNKKAGTLLYFGKTHLLREIIDSIAEGGTQNENKFTAVLKKMECKYKIYPCRKDDRGIWQQIGYSRRHNNYPPG